MSRACDAIGCKTSTAAGRFMCLAHWRKVPTELQRVINGRYRLLRKDFAFLSDVAYLQACVDSIDVIALIEGQQGRNAYQGLLNVARKKQSAGERS
jgi:hypothetical protein